MAELIKIINPDNSIMESTITEEETIDTFNKLKVVVESDDWKSYYKYYFENDYNSYLTESPILIAAGVTGGIIIIIAIIHKLIQWIKNKYRLTTQKLLIQSKELNDIYSKVNDLLSHDKIARFKHRNDKYDAEVHYCVMIDKENPNKVYYVKIDILAYDSKYFINQINEIMRYADIKVKKERSETIVTMVDNLIGNINNGFMEKHGYVVTCDPFMKITKFPNSKLENVILQYKDNISDIYYIIAKLNYIANYQLEYLQALELAYKKMLFDYSKDKDSKEAVDKLFKILIKNVTLSMDFNSKILVIYTDIIKWYSDELHKIYDIIKS